ncbi:MAG: hypothetical protein DRR06_08110 [Gammaproteobacteria bacterium]|nr:MAG: hypothetical protein DRR06_08110 [Gammaproteobacteria bacterium]
MNAKTLSSARMALVAIGALPRLQSPQFQKAQIAKVAIGTSSSQWCGHRLNLILSIGLTLDYSPGFMIQKWREM